MSYPYPQDRHRDRKEKGEQPYKDDRESMTQNDAELQARADEYGEKRPQESDDERIGRLESEAELRLKKVQDEAPEQL